MKLIKIYLIKKTNILILINDIDKNKMSKKMGRKIYEVILKNLIFLLHLMDEFTYVRKIPRN